MNVASGKGTNVELTFAVDPNKVTSAEFPSYPALSDRARVLLQNSRSVLGFDNKSGAELYDALTKSEKLAS